MQQHQHVNAAMGLGGRPARTEGELRVAIRQANERLAAAESVVRAKEAKYEKAKRERDLRFSKGSMKQDAAKAVEGLNFSNLDELRSLKFAPPPIAQLVARCVATLVIGDEFGDHEAYDAEEASLAAQDSPQPPMSARAKQEAAMERLMRAKGTRSAEGVHSPVPMSARGEGPASARGERPSPRAVRPANQQMPTDSLAGARASRSPEQKLSARSVSTPRSATTSRSATTPRSATSRSVTPRSISTPRSAQIEYDVNQARRGELLSWDDTLKLMQRSDFKQRLVSLSGRVLLDNRELVAAVHNCLDLSSIAPGSRVKILPGRAHPGDRLEENRARRELTSILYKEQQEAGVQLNPLTFEEARYVNEVTGAMLIWIHRIFAQHGLLISDWKQASLAVNAAWQEVLAARKVAYNKRHFVEQLELERDELRDHERNLQDIPRPVELVRPPPTHDPKQVHLERPSPNIFFQNGRAAGRSAGDGRAVMWELPARHRLPSVIYFYLRLKSVRVPFPLPPRYPASQFLHEARVLEGQEDLGPVAHVPFDAAHVVGLVDHNLLAFTQIVVEVPSTHAVNADLRPTRLSFHPRHDAQLHDYTNKLHRIIVPVFTTGGVSSERAASAPARERPPLQRTPDIEAAHHCRSMAELAASRVGANPTLAHPPHEAPSCVPQLAIPKLAVPTIGSPFNAELYSKVVHGDEKLVEAGFISAREFDHDGWRSPSPSSRGSGGQRLPGTPKTGAWRNAQLASQKAAEAVHSFRQQRSPSPGARAAAARIAALKAETLVVPLAQRVAEGYMLLEDEMKRLRRYASILSLQQATGPLTKGGVATTHLRHVELAVRHGFSSPSARSPTFVESSVPIRAAAGESEISRGHTPPRPAGIERAPQLQALRPSNTIRVGPGRSTTPPPGKISQNNLVPSPSWTVRGVE